MSSLMRGLALVIAPHLGSWLKPWTYLSFYLTWAQDTWASSVLQGNECPNQQGRGYISFHGLLSQVLHIAFHCLLLGTSGSQVGSDLWGSGHSPLPLHGRRICGHVLRPLQCRSVGLHGDWVSLFRLLDTRKGNSFIEEGSADTALTRVIIADVASRCSASWRSCGTLQ